MISFISVPLFCPFCCVSLIFWIPIFSSSHSDFKLIILALSLFILYSLIFAFLFFLLFFFSFLSFFSLFFGFSSSLLYSFCFSLFIYSSPYLYINQIICLHELFYFVTTKLVSAARNSDNMGFY